MHHPRYMHTHTPHDEPSIKEKKKKVTPSPQSMIKSYAQSRARVLYKYRTKRIHTYILDEERQRGRVITGVAIEGLIRAAESSENESACHT